MSESGPDPNRLYLVRHGQSFANLARLSDGSSKTAGLTPFGARKSRALNLPFSKSTPVRVSELPRTQQTASNAGYDIQIIDSRLNETNLRGASSFRRMANLLSTGWLPEDTLDQAEAYLEKLPPERLVFSSSLTIASICRVAGQPLTRTPRNCEIVIIDIGRFTQVT